MPYGSTTVTTSPTLILAANVNRTSVIVSNSGSTDLYIGQDSSLTTGNAGALVKQDGSFFDGGSAAGKPWLGDIYGRTASGSTTARYWENQR